MITRKKNADTYPYNLREVQIYDLSHENPDINWAFKSEIKELTELAVTDLLNLPPAQISLQLRRLESIKNLFRKFFENYYRFNGPVNNDSERKAYFFSLNLDDIIIVPNISPQDSVVVSQHLLDDLYDSVRVREEYLKDFEKAVAQVLHSENWVWKHFRYSNNGQEKNYTEKYLNDIISSDIKNCQSPILEIEKSSNGQFTVVPAQRIKKIAKNGRVTVG